MGKLHLTSVNYSLNLRPKTLEDWREKLFQDLRQHSASGPGVILYPELFFMGLTSYLQGKDVAEEISLVSDYVWQTLLPELTREFASSESLIILGSAPRKENGKFYNSAPIICRGRMILQDKLHLTPWETHFTAGQEVKSFSFLGLKTAVVICFDIEQPGLGFHLKQRGIDMVLVPSATTNMNGSQRVNRCASGRAIELGALVLTSLLVGDSYCELIDHNEGHHGLYLPAQDTVLVPQEQVGAYSSSEQVVGKYLIDLKMLKEVKTPSSETMPYFKVEIPPHSNDVGILY